VLDETVRSEFPDIPGEKLATPAEARGRLFDSNSAFNMKLPPIPPRAFTVEPIVRTMGLAFADEAA
jgi:hypothetical protein